MRRRSPFDIAPNAPNQYTEELEDKLDSIAGIATGDEDEDEDETSDSDHNQD